MYKVTNWNWGLYSREFDKLEDAVYHYCKECEVARLNHNPEPYITDENGVKIELNEN